MVTVSAATLILMALVGCGPKPAPYDDTEQRVIMGIPPKILMKVPATHEPMTLHITTGLQVGSEPTGDPYRFIGGQRYGEGWADPSKITMVGPCTVRLPNGTRFRCEDWNVKNYPPNW